MGRLVYIIRIDKEWVDMSLNLDSLVIKLWKEIVSFLEFFDYLVIL